MTFGEIIRVNILCMVYNTIFLIMIAWILLGPIPDRGTRHAVKGILFAVILSILGAVFATVCYVKDIWRLPYEIGQILWTYLTLTGWMLFIRFLYEVPLKTCWTTVLFGEILDSYGEILANLFVHGRFFHLDIPQERTTYLFWLLVISPACRLLCLFFVRRVGKPYRQWAERENTNPAVLIALSLYPVVSRALIWLAAFSKGLEGENPMVSFSLLLVVHLFLTYVGRDEQQKRRLEEQQISLWQQTIYIEKMEQIQMEVRRFRHDFKNMMAGMYLQAKEGDLDAIQTFIQDMTEDFDRQAGSQIQMMNQLANVHMTEVKGLLLEKLTQMQREEIRCELEVLRPFENTRMRSTDLCRCLGILLDNAIEEVGRNKDGRIHIMISRQNDCTTFRIKNTLYGTVDISRLGYDGYSSKGNGRGIGLQNYRTILEKYYFVFPGTSVQNGCFIQELKIQES